MIVFRITLVRYSDRLQASGREARWNSKGVFVIYTAASRSLACLENLVHRSGQGLDRNFKTMIIEIPESVKVQALYPESLQGNWKSYLMQKHTRAIGDNWIKSGDTAVLKVPSAIVPDEYNFLLNPAHQDFAQIKLSGSEDFSFDRRLR